MSNTTSHTKGKIGGGILALVAVVVAIFAVLAIVLTSSVSGASSAGLGNNAANAAPSPRPTAEQEKACADTWVIVEADNTNNRWFFEGIASIRDAKTNEEATAAAYDWQEKVRTDPDLLVGAAKVFFPDRNFDRNSFVDSKNCATKAAVDLNMEIGTAIATSVITPDDVDPNAHNTGTGVDGSVIGDASGGIGGDLSAVQLTLSDGRVIWIMARCGNLATPGAPSLPPGPTDNPPRCAYNPQLPPDSPDCAPPVEVCPPGMHGTPPVCKDDPSNDPEQQDNNKPGGGGQAPEQTDPVGPPAGGEPPEVYVPPAPPVVEVPEAPIVVPEPVTEDPPIVVDPVEDPPSNGQIPEEGGANCNSEYQTCP
jgi:hypothetical protein